MRPKLRTRARRHGGRAQRCGLRLSLIALAAIAGCGSGGPSIQTGGPAAAEAIARLVEEQALAALSPVPPITTVTTGCHEVRTNIFQCGLQFELDEDTVDVDVEPAKQTLVEHTDAFRALPGTTVPISTLADAESYDASSPVSLIGIRCTSSSTYAYCEMSDGPDPIGVPGPSVAGCFRAPPIVAGARHSQARFPAMSMLSAAQLARALAGARTLLGPGTVVTWLEASPTELELVIAKHGAFGEVVFHTQGPPVERSIDPTFGTPIQGFALGSVDSSTPEKLAGRIARATGISPSQFSTVTAQTYGDSPIQWSLGTTDGCRQFQAGDAAAPITEWAAPGSTTTIG